MFLSSVLASSLGIFIVGNIGESHSSYPSTVLGPLVGSSPLLIRFEEPYYLFEALTYGTLLQTAGGIIGFNLSRRYDHNEDVFNN